MRLLDDAERAGLLRELPGWCDMPERRAIGAAFRFKDFRAAWAFMAQVAALADTQDHHPEWSNTYNRVSVVLTTHDAGGVTERDARLARSIAALAAAQPGSPGAAGGCPG